VLLVLVSTPYLHIRIILFKPLMFFSMRFGELLVMISVIFQFHRVTMTVMFSAL
jgi:hypothetical protein